MVETKNDFLCRTDHRALNINEQAMGVGYALDRDSASTHYGNVGVNFVEGFDRMRPHEDAQARMEERFSDVLQRYFSSYVDQKLATYKKRFERTQTELAQVNANIDAALKQQKELTANHTLPPTEKLLLLSFGKSKVVIGQLTVLLFELAFHFVPTALEL